MNIAVLIQAAEYLDRREKGMFKFFELEQESKTPKTNSIQSSVYMSESAVPSKIGIFCHF